MLTVGMVSWLLSARLCMKDRPRPRTHAGHQHRNGRWPDALWFSIISGVGCCGELKALAGVSSSASCCTSSVSSGTPVPMSPSSREPPGSRGHNSPVDCGLTDSPAARLGTTATLGVRILHLSRIVDTKSSCSYGLSSFLGHPPYQR